MVPEPSVPESPERDRHWKNSYARLPGEGFPLKRPFMVSRFWSGPAGALQDLEICT